MSINVATASREELICRITELDDRVCFLENRVEWFKRQLFGVKSEKLIWQDPKQSTLFEVSEEPPVENTTVKAYERGARRNPTDASDLDGIRFDETVPVDEEVIWPKEVEGLSADAYEVIGEKITQRLAQTPVQYRIKRTIRKTVKLRETKTLHTAPAPAAVIERSFADVTLLAGLITDKFQYHLPLYRQHQRLEASGVHISRGHLTKLVHRSLELLEPVYYSILSAVTTSETVSMDETPIKASRKERGKMKTAYFWPVYAEEQVAFVYSSSRGHRVIADILGQGCKKLLSDGFSAYEAYARDRQDLIHAQCWAHVRRQFFEAKEHSPPEAEQALSLIRLLFEIEAKVNNCDDPTRLQVRREESLSITDSFFSYLHQLWFEQQIDRSSLLGKAVAYARERQSGLTHFLRHPDIPLSNNHVERAIRPVALGRKNWLFCWSEIGAKYAAIAFTLVESCKLHAIDPWQYLVDILQRIDSHPARDVHLLTPKLWKEHFAEDVNNAA